MPAVNDDATQNKVTGTAASQQERVQSIYCVSEKYF
jgi:hypothetical protein